jgi:pimeloyl-ACP methyl ester carboxylesterase
VVALLHGNGEDARVFDAMAPWLAGFKTVALEARGHGRSPRGPEPLTIPRLAADAARALDAARGGGGARGDGGARCGIVGFSDGANVALELALHRPDLVRGLVLIGGNLTPAGLKPGVRVATVATYAGLVAAGLVSRRRRARAEVWGLMVGQPRIDAADLARIEAPALVVAGQKDLIARRHTELIAHSIPGSELVIVPGQGHMLPLTAPAVLGRLAAAFLSSLA